MRSSSSSPRALVLRLATVLLLAGSIPVLGMALSASAQANLTVDSTADEPDANVGDGNCVSTGSGKCTLRAAVQEIDPGGTITVPAGLYVLSIAAGTESGPPNDPNVGGDLDFSKDVTIVGAGADRTVIDGNNAHRVVDVHVGGAARISKVTLRNGLADVDPFTGHVHGGIIHNHGTLELTESTVSGGVSNVNANIWGGGGITNAGNGTATLRNDTLARNSTTYYGGGIENGGALTLNYVTITDNTAPAGQGGGLASGVGFFATATGTATPQSSILAANNGGNCRGPTIASGGYNLEDTATCPFINTGDQTGQNPMLSPLNNAQGSIWVYALQPGSPALDKANPLNCPGTDERGVTRPQEGNGAAPAFCDVGAFELAPAAPTTMCDGRTPTITGTAGNNTIQGTANADVIAGLGGNDTIYGNGGADRICGGMGKDVLRGGNQNDRVFGNQQNDTLYGGNGNDLLNGGRNTDRCVGGPGSNTKISCES